MNLTIKSNKLVIIKRDRILFIPLNEIFNFERFNQKTYIQTYNEEIHIRDSLKYLETILPEQFKRTHRSFIINTEHVRELKVLNNNTYEAFLPGDNQALVNRELIKLVL
ncbi:response regulator [Planococcus donghaensis MPA1U2]|uniref:Response regulator n=1 Tax=Planococcus donghaensis MPA1U2 TaxID=933115 RepID=E7RCN8_9BACL|nr:LytTR family DNA-binding domain-containing protein [Planococcus donghaensis]EGA91403.1 response regulator [Planococcus donghaensis MPA1U2]